MWDVHILITYGVLQVHTDAPFKKALLSRRYQSHSKDEGTGIALRLDELPEERI